MRNKSIIGIIFKHYNTNKNYKIDTYIRNKGDIYYDAYRNKKEK